MVPNRRSHSDPVRQLLPINHLVPRRRSPVHSRRSRISLVRLIDRHLCFDPAVEEVACLHPARLIRTIFTIPRTRTVAADRKRSWSSSFTFFAVNGTGGNVGRTAIVPSVVDIQNRISSSPVTMYISSAGTFRRRTKILSQKLMSPVTQGTLQRLSLSKKSFQLFHLQCW